jgi:hypothetical protein
VIFVAVAAYTDHLLTSHIQDHWQDPAFRLSQLVVNVGRESRSRAFLEDLGVMAKPIIVRAVRGLEGAATLQLTPTGLSPTAGSMRSTGRFAVAVFFFSLPF